MPPQLKPLVLYGGVLGPNPSKVSMILNELNIPWETHYVPFSEVKGAEYRKVNPNGRLPTLIDPNNGIKIWESGAIVEYLIEKYDPENKISFPVGTEEYYLCKQWLHFQMSGQGPYYGQLWWFKNSHPEKIESAIDRYIAEIRRVSGVLDGQLAEREWLVGGKCTYADLCFIAWQELIPRGIGDKADLAKEFPHLQAWLERMIARPGVKKVLEEKAERVAEMKRKELEEAAKSSN